MPCDCSHLEASTFERDISRVFCLLGELDGTPWTRSWWDGYHPSVYSVHLSEADADRAIASLCQRLQSVDVTKLSLEMQIWWRDHQAADAARVQREIAAARDNLERQAAIEKLTPHERRLLNLKP